MEAWSGGKIRYEWSDGQGNGFYLTGEFVALEPFRRIVHVERTHLPDPTPDNRIETTFEQDGSGMSMTMRMTSPDAGTREAMPANGMEQGMEASYVRLETIIQAIAIGGGGTGGRRRPGELTHYLEFASWTVRLLYGNAVTINCL